MAHRRVLLLAAVPLLAYASAPKAGFIWDDHRSIEEGRAIGSLANVPALFVHDTMWNSDGGKFATRARVDTYRPLTMTTLFLDHALFGVRAAAYHVVNVLFHLACVLLLARVGRKLGLSEWAAAFGALLFAAHPAICEAVYWVNGRSDPLCLLFFLLALDAWIDGRAGWAAGAMLAATLCKETAFMLAPAVLFLVPRLRVSFRSLWPWAVGGAAGIGLRLFALGRPAASAGGHHLTYALARLPALWLDAIFSLVLPQAETAPSLYQRYHQVPAARTLLAIAVFTALVAVAIRHRSWLFGWALASFLLALAPVALLTFDEGWFGWGRYLYPACAPLALFAGAKVVEGLARLRHRARLLRLGQAACALAVALFAGETLAAGRDYRDDRAFAEAMIADHAGSPHGYYELATVELREGDAAGALESVRRAIALDVSARHLSLEANALMQLGRRAEAYATAARTLELDPRDPNARYLIAIARLEQHRGAEAAGLLLDAIADEPGQEGPWETLRSAAAHLGPTSDFVVELKRRVQNPLYASIAPRVLAAVK